MSGTILLMNLSRMKPADAPIALDYLGTVL
jgi:hypothetical protein